MSDPRRFILWSERELNNCIAFLRALPFPDGKTVKRPFRVEIDKYVESMNDHQRGGFHLLVGILAR